MSMDPEKKGQYQFLALLVATALCAVGGVAAVVWHIVTK